VGYGDLTPETHLARFFTCFYALLGVTALGIALGSISSNIVEAQERAVEEARESHKDKTLSLFSDEKGIMNHLRGTGEKEQQNQATPDISNQKAVNNRSWGMLLQRTRLLFQRRSSGTGKVVLSLAWVLIVLAFFGFAVAHDPAITPANAAYFLIITSTTW